MDHKDGKVFVNGREVYDTDAQDDQLLYTAEEEFKVKLYSSAIEELAGEHPKYTKNYNLWQRWDMAMRLWWIDQIEAQAQRGAQTIGVDMVSRAVEIRLTRS